MEIKDNFDKLLNSGWEIAPHFYGRYSLIKTDIKGRKHQIQLDESRPHLVSTHRIQSLNTIIVDGYIGNFVGGKGRKRATNFKKYLDENFIDNIV